MISEINEKTFIQSLKDIVTRPGKAKQYLQDRRITQLEKNIIRASLDLRDGKFQAVVNSLESMTCQSQVVESQKFYFLGSAYNNLSHFNKAIEYFEKSYEIGHKYKIHFRDFSIIYSLIICHLNLQKHQRVIELYEELKNIGAKDPKEEIDLSFAQFFAESAANDLALAGTTLDKLFERWAEMSDHQKILFLVVRFDLCVKKREFSLAYEVLESFKKVKKFYSKGNFKFMKALLDHLVDGKEIYLYEKDFEGQNDLLTQVKIINFLREGNREQAAELWKHFMQTAPEVYQDNFTYKGEVCLFSLCLEKNLKGLTLVPDVELEDDDSKEDKILKILKQRKGPVAKEEIFRLVYGRDPHDKADLHKLTALIYILRRKMNLEIKTQKGCYYLAS